MEARPPVVKPQVESVKCPSRDSPDGEGVTGWKTYGAARLAHLYGYDEQCPRGPGDEGVVGTTAPDARGAGRPARRGYAVYLNTWPLRGLPPTSRTMMFETVRSILWLANVQTTFLSGVTSTMCGPLPNWP